MLQLKLLILVYDDEQNYNLDVSAHSFLACPVILVAVIKVGDITVAVI